MSLFDRLFGDPELNNISDKIDQVFKVLDSDTIVTDDPIEDSTGKLVDSFLDESTPEDIGKIFQNISIPAERLARYNIYEEIYKSIPIIKRIIKVYIANIIQKNPVDGKCLIYRLNPNIPQGEEHNQKKENAEKFSRKIIEHYKLLEKVKRYIIPRKLLYGDCYVEVVDLRKEYSKVDLNKTNTSVLTETTINNLDAEITKASTSKLYNTDPIVSKIADCLIEYEDISLKHRVLTEQDDSSILIKTKEEKSKKENEDPKKDAKAGLEDIIIKIHKPHNISILETEYGVVIGYLEIKEKLDMASSGDLGQSLQKMIGKLTSTDRQNPTAKEKLVDKLLKHMVKTITEKVNKTNVSSDPDSAVKSLGDDVYYLIKRMFIEQGIYNKTAELKPLRVRFIPVTKMVAFSNASADYAPHGESVIEPLVLPSKLYLLTQLANIVTKLSRSALIRTWRLDVGSSQMHSQMIQRLKRELSNTRITLADLGSFKSIPKLFSDFKDLFILSKNGQTPVDVNVQAYGDTTIKVADLEDARREIISLSGIPAPYLGYMD